MLFARLTYSLLCLLQSVSFEVQAGKLTALVGPSGSGKTSCISLLKRLYEAQEGQILLDGRPLHHYRIKYLQQKVQPTCWNQETASGGTLFSCKSSAALFNKHN